MADQAARSSRGRGRPPGQTAQALQTRRRLYETAIGMIATRGWQETTLRDVAGEAGVSVGLLYRYFPSKRAIVLTLYDELSADYAARAVPMRPGRWRERFLDALEMSLEVLGPHRETLARLVPVLVGDPNEGLFARGTAFSRERVQAVFVEAVLGATDAPRGRLVPALGRLLYLAHLAILLWWLLDKSPSQRATSSLIALLRRALPLAATSLRVAAVPRLLVAADALVREALLDGTPEAEPSSQKSPAAPAAQARSGPSSASSTGGRAGARARSRTAPSSAARAATCSAWRAGSHAALPRSC